MNTLLGSSGTQATHSPYRSAIAAAAARNAIAGSVAERRSRPLGRQSKYPGRMSVRRARRRPVAPDDLYRLRFVSDPQVSPDGSQVAYVVAWVDPKDHTRYRSQIMLAPFDGARPPRPLTSGRNRDSAPRWSPDSCFLAFLSDRDNDRSQVFLLPLQGGEPRQLTSLKRGAGAPVWSPEGDRIAFSARVDVEDIARQEGQSEEKGKAPRVKIITRVHHKGDGEGFFEALRRHLFVLRLDD